MARKSGWLERGSRKVTEWAGSSAAFALACLVILVWGITGPIFSYSDTWQLVINTGTTIVTFLMVFLIQRSQNKDSRAIHLKLNELVAAVEGASNRLISAEDLCEDDVEVIGKHFRKLGELAKKDEDLTCSHSIEEAEAEHARKKSARARTKAKRARKRKHQARDSQAASTPTAADSSNSTPLAG
jgi:low affinity Fe/Cu permease